MSPSGRFGVLLAAASIALTFVAPVATAAPHDPRPTSGSMFTPVSPTRVFDTRTGGHQIPADSGITIRFPANLVPADATAVVFNLTGTNASGPTYLAVTTPGDFHNGTSNLNLVAGQTRANLVTSPASLDAGTREVELWTGNAATDAIVDLAGYYAPSTGKLYTSVAPQRVLDTRDAAPVGPGGTVTLDLSSKVPAGTTAAVFNLTGTDVTGSTFVTAYPDGQAKPDASNLNLEAGQTVPNLVTVQLSADRKVTLANAHSSVDLIADLAGYYSPDSNQYFYPLQPLRALDTRDQQENPREPLGPGGVHTVDFGGWLPAGATAAVYNLTATNVTGSTYLTAWPHGTDRSSASNLNLDPGQTAANMAITALSQDGRVDLFNHVGQTDVITDLAGYFAGTQPACLSQCVYTWGMNDSGQRGNGTTDSLAHQAADAYGLDSAVQVAQDGNHVFALRADGTVWNWGGNSGGELTTGRPGGSADAPGYALGYYATMPGQVLGLHDIAQLQPDFALAKDGTVWSWGGNYMWQLGNGNTDVGAVPPSAVQVSNLTGVVAIAGEIGNHYALKSDGTVWAWGNNTRGELGDGLAPDPNGCSANGGISPVGPNCASATPVQVAGLDHVTKLGVRLAVKDDGTVWQFGGVTTAGNPLTPQQVPGATGAVAVAGESYVAQYTYGTAYALMPDGTVKAWGAGGYGQLGNGGDCGIGNCPSSAAAVQVSGLTGVKSIAGRGVDAYALKSDGTVWAWGAGSDGALGDGDWIGRNSSVPVQVPGLQGVTAIGDGGVAVANP